MAYEERIIDEVQAASNIVDIISEHVPLKRAGRNFKGICPFHEEKTPSFMVSAEKQIFHCFGCGAGGNVFRFLMRVENLSFPEVLRRLAERAHIVLPEPEGRRDPYQASENEQILEAYRHAAAFYHNLFRDGRSGQRAREYLKQRGFDMAFAEEFQLGWAPDSWGELYSFLRGKGLSDETLLKARLIARGTSGKPFDMFRGRLMFPILNLQGKPIAFGGRILGTEEGPKYLNSPEHPVFKKRREFYGLSYARKYIDRDLPRLFVVEGYMDFLRLVQHGFRHTVATLGTALTPEHVQTLKRFADEALVVYDGDRAGQAAALRGLEIFLEGGLNVKIVRMPDGLDPDDFLVRFGAEAFREQAAQAVDFFDFKLDVLAERYDRRDSLGLMKMTSDFIETLSKVSQPVLLDRYMRRLSGYLGVDERSLRLELDKLKKKRSAPVLSGSPVAESTVKKQTDLPEAGREEMLLAALLVDEPRFRDQAFREIQAEEFLSSPARKVFETLRELDAEGSGASWNRILTRLEDESFKEKLIAGISLEWTAEEKEKAFLDCMRVMKKKQFEARLKELRREIAMAERAGDQARVHAFLAEYQTLLQQMR